MRIASSGWNQGYGARASAISATSAPDEDPQAKRLQNMQQGLAKLKAMPADSAQDKAGYLQRRLLELKQMLLHASPQQAKALLQELRSIAGDLSAMAKAGGGGASQAGVAAVDGAQAVTAVSGSSSLQGVLSQASQALKEVVAMIKSKLAHAPREDRDRVHEVEQKASELDSALAHGDIQSDVYTGIGDFIDVAASSSAPTINITV